MEERRTFEQYLEEIGSHISNKKRQAELREELLGHLEEKKEFLMIKGVSEEEAEQKVLEEMGDSKELSRTFGVLHSVFPRDEQGRMFTLLLLGAGLSMLHIETWYWELLLPSAGSLILLWFMAKIRKIEPRFEKGFWCAGGLVLLQICRNISYSIPDADYWYDERNIIGLILHIICLTVFWCFFFWGMKDYAQKKKAYAIATRIETGPWFYMGSWLLVFGAHWTPLGFLFSHSYNLWESVLDMLPLLGVLGTLFRIKDIQNWLWEQEILLPTQSLWRHEKYIGILLACLVFLVPLGLQAAVTFAPMEEVVYVKDEDYELHERAEAVREQMAALDVYLDGDSGFLYSARFLDLIPDEEIIKYEGVTAVEVRTFGRSYDNKSVDKTWAVLCQLPNDRLRVLFVTSFEPEEEGVPRWGYRNIIEIHHTGSLDIEDTTAFVRTQQNGQVRFWEPIEEGRGEFHYAFSYRVPKGGDSFGTMVYMGATLGYQIDLESVLQFDMFNLKEYRQTALLTSPVLGVYMREFDAQREGYDTIPYYGGY